jgi:hypothetical protein
MKKVVLETKEISQHFGVRIFVFMWPLGKGAM